MTTAGCVPERDAGVEVAVHDLGGEGPPLVLAHAAGLHGRVFAPLAAELEEAFHCWAPDFRGHGDTTTPVGLDFEWSGFADDVLATLEVLGHRTVFGFGHSSGGAALLMAAAREPDRFSGLVCFEPIVWPDVSAAVQRAQGLAEGARRRRPSFATKEDAYANYESKPPFSWLDERALAAYVEHGFAESDDGTVALKCPPQIEALIYLRGAESDAFNALNKVECPVVIARGTERGAIDREVIEDQVGEVPAGTILEFPGLGHFGPLEAPAAIAKAIRQAFLD